MATCTLTRSTQNTSLWTQKAEDKYVKCTNTDQNNCLYKAITQTVGTFTTTSDGSTVSWTNPLPDDDEEDPYCTPPADASTSSFAC